MNIYLAGKIDDKYGSWRTGLLGGTRYLTRSLRGGEKVHLQRPRWIQVQDLAREYHSSIESEIEPWPTEPNAWIFDRHCYVGPFRQESIDGLDGSHSGTFHGSETYGSHGEMDPAGKIDIVRQCRMALYKADLVFAYLNSPDCYGTLVEIGYAVALGKYVYIAQNEDAYFEWDDYWFVEEMVNNTRSIYRSESPRDFFGFGSKAQPEEEAVSRALQEAIIDWVAWKEKRGKNFGEVVKNAEYAALQECLQGFQSIEQWSSDPRVRHEASRMVERLTGGKAPRRLNAGGAS